MANNFASLTQVINAAALAAVGNKLAFVKDITTDFSSQVTNRLRNTVKVPLLSGSAAVLDPTTFGGGNSGSTLATITMQHVHVPFYVSNAEVQNGYKLEELIETHINVLCDKIQAMTFAPILSSLPTAVSVANTAFSLSSLQAAWRSIPGSRKQCYVDSVAFSNFLTNNNQIIDPMVGIPYAGFDKFGYFDVATGLDTGVYGFVQADKKGLVAASAIPEVAPRAAALMETVLIELPHGLTAALNVWGDTADRSDNASLDIFYGAALGVPNMLKVIKA